ncbi:thiol-disulfide oxidoreductase DCC family protein [Rhodothermus profundi]|uniref:Predicted thiol-disulfide oxidoreductase YuxK, DCC family n=1 Tax=Rhodothermus profundi TaxID=633813 RepID=A0A1M6V8V4_9BACT|nr:thiol-disulfide oxidoreductase DCC family protein [Rhodothermus profundi]SHK77878.1 Predicted thiol-disulfide oxidoreductase YuxK, DCC family [Rhodothermus profundi]
MNSAHPTGEAQHGIVLFDGVCNLCNGFINFVIDRDPAGYFKFGALQSEAARPYLERFGLQPDYLDSIILIEGGRCYRDSTAALRILRRLRGLWPLLYGLIVVPRPLRDAVYRWVARHRYRWFGRRAQCRVPTPDLLARFLESPLTASFPENQKSSAA